MENLNVITFGWTKKYLVPYYIISFSFSSPFETIHFIRCSWKYPRTSVCKRSTTRLIEICSWSGSEEKKRGSWDTRRFAQSKKKNKDFLETEILDYFSSFSFLFNILKYFVIELDLKKNLCVSFLAFKLGIE